MGLPITLAVGVGLALLPGDASAAALRVYGTAFSAFAALALFVLMREWPVELSGALWAGAALLVGYGWMRSRATGVRWLLPAGAGRVPLGRSAAGPWAEPARPSTLVARRPGLALPATTHPDRVLEGVRQCFLTLQAAWDANDIEALRVHTTAEMLDQLLEELPLRGGQSNRTDVLRLDAALLGFEDYGSRYLAVIEFSGLIRESAEQGEVPFKELWMLTCGKGEAAGWQLARQQALL